MRASRLSGFHKLSLDHRLSQLQATGWLRAEDLESLREGAPERTIEGLSENVVGRLSLPLSVVTNVRVNGIDRLVPMATEEPSIVAACSNGARMVREAGGVEATSGTRQLRAEVLVHTQWSKDQLDAFLQENLTTLLKEANAGHKRLSAAGGGLKRITWRLIDSAEALVVFDLHCHPADAMGANAVNDMAEEVARHLTDSGVGEVQGAIVSNHIPDGWANASVVLPPRSLAASPDEGERLAGRIATLSRWAIKDPFRRATHVKGILNGIQAVATALYQDTRALASTLWSGLSPQDTVVRWRYEDGLLKGEFSGPITCGTVGGSGPAMATTALFYDWLHVANARELEEVLAAVGLLQNLAALRAIAAEGIQRGHMRLHARKHEEGHE